LDAVRGWKLEVLQVATASFQSVLREVTEVIVCLVSLSLNTLLSEASSCVARTIILMHPHHPWDLKDLPYLASGVNSQGEQSAI
jgi:hypothetical protein